MSVKLLGHHVHPILVTFPIGLLGGSIAFDVVYLATGAALWADISFWTLASGVIAGLVAAPFGALDWLSVPSGTRAKRIGLYHGAAAVVAVGLFAVSGWLRYETPAQPETAAIIVSFVAMAVLLTAGWFGGELVARLGVGVDPGAHTNSPSSLSDKPASDSSHMTSV